MKNLIPAVLTATVMLSIVSCEKRDTDLREKLSQLEQKAAEATERQRQLEAELAAQKIAVEQESIERERTLLEQERLHIAEQSTLQNAAAAAEIEKRSLELAEREAKVNAQMSGLEVTREKLTGLESSLTGRELALAGREPVNSLRSSYTPVTNRPTADYSSFYEPLGAYGSWFETSQFGYVYQPTVVRDVSWRPYTRGRWAFTDQGWTWVSNEAFGWACYHYGRWALLRNAGWVWVPGNEWAPAWVTWRESNSHIGWAPLPPETLAWSGRSWDSSVESTYGIGMNSFSFVPYHHFGTDIHRHCLPVSQNVTVYRHTVNTTCYHVSDHRVFVGGPRYQTVCTHIGRPFPVHHLRMNQSPYIGRGGGSFQSRYSGNELYVTAPCMQAGWNQALQPSRIRSRLDYVSVDRTHELDGDILHHFQETRSQEIAQAVQIVSGAGANFEQNRLKQLETARIETQKEAARSEPAAPNLVENMPGPLTAEPITATAEESAPEVIIRALPIAEAPVVASGETIAEAVALPSPGNETIIEQPLPSFPSPSLAMPAPQEPSAEVAAVPVGTVLSGEPEIPETAPVPVASGQTVELLSSGEPEMPRISAPTLPETAEVPVIPGEPKIANSDVTIPARSEEGLAQAGEMRRQENQVPADAPREEPLAETPTAQAPQDAQMNQLNEQQEAATRLARESQMNQVKEQALREEDLRQQQARQLAMQQQEAAERLAQDTQMNQVKEQAQRGDDLRQQQARQAEMQQQEAATRLARDTQMNQAKEQAQRADDLRQQQARQAEMQQQEAATRLAQEAQMNQVKEQAQREAAMRQQQEEAQREAAMRQQQEQAQREAAMRQQQEQAQREAAMRQQQEQAQREAAMRQQQEQAQREAAMRQQQEQAQREAAMRQQQEQAQREEAKRQQQEEARRQQQEEARRQQQEEARRQQQEEAQRQQQEAQRQQQEDQNRRQQQEQ